ncbi:uncharacterized protein LOC130553519 isoform X2 [Triplophysa rosa]|uniref:Glycosyl hydrolases family 22 (GH22) domain-containing protein n=2 Tax=Triplophysa rosa TaxID=992332 RepID=A0A9W7X032_TRIRA|nr:uncharacterized protein LOC130553519 isoform X2 [Triplophysa rosa]KAI7811369.1 hypothetical protein IRJ41_013748 [Triplophysa rosa]
MLKMLGVLALVLLVSTMNEGRIVSKCELKAQLDAVFGANMTGNMTQDTPANMTGNMTQDTPANMTGNMTGELIARLVCAVERTSRFNTSLVTTIQLPPPTQNSQKPNGPHQKRGEKPDRPHQKPHEGRPGGKPGDSHGGRPGSKPREKRSPPRAPGRGRDRPPAGSSGVSPGTTMNLYGIFQLSDRVACDSGSNQTVNICRMNCNALIDDDIRDDIACLKTLMGFMCNVTITPPPLTPRLMNMDVTFVEECRSVVPSQYFSACV